MNWIKINLVITYAIESMIMVVTPIHFEPLDGLGPLPLTKHTIKFIFKVVSNNAMLIFMD
jgi:hypothetical protein